MPAVLLIEQRAFLLFNTRIFVKKVSLKPFNSQRTILLLDRTHFLFEEKDIGIVDETVDTVIDQNRIDTVLRD